MSGINGFLGSRGSLMLDVVFLAMFAVVPVMFYSIYLVKSRRQYQLHKTIQILLGVVLLVAVTAFEVDMRFFTDWKTRAAASPFFKANEWCGVWYALVIHLCFAIPTTLLWVVVIVQALRRFPAPPTPSAYSHAHAKLGWLAAIGMTMTAITGWIFYALAFIAA